MKKVNPVLFLCMIWMPFTSSSQNKRFSADIHGGIPITFASIKGSLSTFGGVGLRYNLSKEISVEGLMEVGSLTGKQNASSYMSPDQNSNYTGFINNFFAFTGNIQLNLDKALKIRKHFNRFNPYLVFGTGFMQSTVISKRIDGLGKKYDQIFYMSYTGLIGRYYISSEVDFTFGINYYYSQTFYIDAIPVDQKNDTYMLNYIGITYKIGAKPDKQHVEWSNVIIIKRPPRIKAPKHPNGDDINPDSTYRISGISRKKKEPSEPMPWDDEETQILFYRNKIAKVQAANRSLVMQNEEQKEEIVILKDTISALQKQINDLRSMLEGMKQKELLAAREKDSLRMAALNPVKLKKGKVPVKLIAKTIPKTMVLPIPTVEPDQSKNAKKNDTAQRQVVVIPVPVQVVNKLVENGKETQTDTSTKNEIVAVSHLNYKPGGELLVPEETEKLIQPYHAKGKKAKTRHFKKKTAARIPIPGLRQPAVTSAAKPVAIDEKPVVLPKKIVSKKAAKSKPVTVLTLPKASGTSLLKYSAEIKVPSQKYNVIVGAYKSRKYAFRFRNALLKKGIQAVVYKWNPVSRLMFVGVNSTNNRKDAIRYMREARIEIDQGAWLHLFKQ